MQYASKNKAPFGFLLVAKNPTWLDIGPKQFNMVSRWPKNVYISIFGKDGSTLPQGGPNQVYQFPNTTQNKHKMAASKKEATMLGTPAIAPNRPDMAKWINIGPPSLRQARHRLNIAHISFQNHVLLPLSLSTGGC